MFYFIIKLYVDEIYFEYKKTVGIQNGRNTCSLFTKSKQVIPKYKIYTSVFALSINRGWKLPLLKVMLKLSREVFQVCQTRQIYLKWWQNCGLCFHFATAPFPNAALNSLRSFFLKRQSHKIVLDRFRARARRIKSILSLSSSSKA